MGQKDVAEKLLEDYNDVFMDIVNVLLFDGEPLVKEDELVNVKDRSQYKIANKLHEQERDVAKFWNKGEVQIALCGLENQTKIDKDMPLRVMGYDGAAYRYQLKDDKKARYPVVTMVLYFGKEHWKSRTLHERLNVPEKVKSYVSDYKINVFEIAYLEEEQVELFRSDFRFVADYFVQMRKNGDYKPSRETIRHVDETLKLMAVLTQDDRFLEAQNELGGSVKNMCEAMDKAEARGEVKKLLTLVCRKLQKGKTFTVIAEELEDEPEYIEQLCRIAEKFAPEYDVEKIYEELQSVRV